MRGSQYTTAAILSLPALSNAVSLADFPPAVSNLPSSCDTLYTAQISGCSSTDFTGSSGCSDICIKALGALTSKVVSACDNHGISGENIIVAFLANSGPGSICTNTAEVSSVLSGTSTSVTSTSAATSTPQSSTTSPTTTTTTDDNTSSTSSSETSTATSTASSTQSQTTSTSSASTITSTTKSTASSSGLNYDSSTPSSVSSSATKTTSIPAQYTYAGSQGGSPFDTALNSSNAGASSFSTAPLALVVAIAAMMLFGIR